MISEDPRSAEVIKPFLAGRDIKRYHTPSAEKHLILIPKGFTRQIKLSDDDLSIDHHHISNVDYVMNEEEAWTVFNSQYPAISLYLTPYNQKAKKRNDKGDY